MTFLCSGLAWYSSISVGGAEVQLYVLQMNSGLVEGEEMVEMYRGPEDSCVIQGLLPGRRYLCQVRKDL